MKSEKMIADGYKYCKKHDQHFLQYCSSCVLNMPRRKIKGKKLKSRKERKEK